MAAYIAQGVESKHLLGAVIMTAPGTLLIAKTLVPETETTVSGSKVEYCGGGRNQARQPARGHCARHQRRFESGHQCRGHADCVSGADRAVERPDGLGAWLRFGWFPGSLQTVLGWLFAPVAWLIGIPVEGRHAHRQSCWASAWWATN
jgi:concentrative nucleoside transporter, CNT family